MIYLKCTPLDDYVNRLDLTYNYDVMSRWEREGYTVHNINLTSQTWKTGKFYTKTWKSDKFKTTSIETRLIKHAEMEIKYF